jgi:adenine deaminase
MDYPAVASGNPDMMQKITDALAVGKTVDGHGAGLTPEQIAEYRAVGIDTDHEAVNAKEAAERAALGMHILIREGTVEQDELAILPAITAQNQRRFSFATDDKTAVDIAENGGVDHNVRLAMQNGVPAASAITMATLNAAEAHHLTDVGAIAAGYEADLVVLDDVASLMPAKVMVSGAWVDDLAPAKPNPFAQHLMNVNLTETDLVLPLQTGRAHVIDVRPFHIDTVHTISAVPVNANGEFEANAEFAKITVAERYHDLGNGVGIIRGLGLREGAIGTTFSNDSHNVVVAGVNDAAMVKTVDVLREVGGGMVVVGGDMSVAVLPLEIGGLMTAASFDEVVAKTQELHQKVGTLSDAQFDVFQTLSFMALPVIPSLKITDQGLFDFDTWSFIGIDAE